MAKDTGILRAISKKRKIMPKMAVVVGLIYPLSGFRPLAAFF
jgi:hypothetical protein